MRSDLNELKRALDDQHHGHNWFRVVTTRWGAGDLVLEAILRDGSGSETGWEVRCQGVLEYTISDVEGGGLNHLADPEHPALRRFLDPQASLFFRGIAVDTPATIGDLWLGHRNLCDDWISFDRIVRRDVQLDELLSAGYGQLAEGPRFLLDVYADVLRRHGVRSSLTEDRPFRSWTGKHFVEVNHAEGLHFGDSVIIAESLSALRVREG